jgi:hypothetical protein
LGIASPENYLEVANRDFRAAGALRDDLLAVVFPHGDALPSELLQTRVKLKIQSLVNGFEAMIEGQGAGQKCWDILSKSGLLREPELIEFAVARVNEETLLKNLNASDDALPLTQLAVSLFDHDNPRIAGMAKSLLHAEQQAAGGHPLFHRLSPELLHLLCWRVVAALQEIDDEDSEMRIARAQSLLSQHDAESDPSAIARKLVFFLGPDYRSALLDPRKAGLQLFIATLAQEFSLSRDLLFGLIGPNSIAPLLIILRAADVPLAQLPSILVGLFGSECVHQSSQIADSYATIDPIDARAQISDWADGRETVS